jgi:hypothetical protein
LHRTGVLTFARISAEQISIERFLNLLRELLSAQVLLYAHSLHFALLQSSQKRKSIRQQKGCMALIVRKL